MVDIITLYRDITVYAVEDFTQLTQVDNEPVELDDLITGKRVRVGDIRLSEMQQGKHYHRGVRLPEQARSGKHFYKNSEFTRNDDFGKIEEEPVNARGDIDIITGV